MTHRKRLFLWVALGLVFLLAGAVTWLWTANLGVFKPQIERLVSNATGRELRIDGELVIELGRQSFLVANGIRLQNATWADEPEMLKVERLEVRIDLWSLYRGPIVVDMIDVDGVQVRLARLEDGTANWTIGEGGPRDRNTDEVERGGFDVLFGEITVDDAELVFESPERTGPIQVRVDSLRQRQRDDDFLDLSVSGAIGDRAVRVEGEVGTWQSLLTGENIHYTLDGDFDVFSVSSSGFIDSLLAPRRPSMTFTATGPDINDLLTLARIEASGEGDIRLEGQLAASDNEPLQLDIEGNVGQLEVDAKASFSNLADFETVDIDVSATGPDLSRILRLFDIHSIREAPFMVDLEARRQGSRLTVRSARVELAAAELNVAAEIPNFPDVHDANISVRVNGADIERFRDVLNLPGTATGPFSIAANLETGDDGIEIANMTVNTELGLLVARGTLGEEPGLVGSELQFDLQAPSLSRIAGSYGLPRLPDEPIEISGSAVLEAEGVRTIGPIVLQVQNVTATVDGLLRSVRGLYGSRLNYSLDGPNLAGLVNAFADTEFVPTQPYSLTGVLEIENDGFGFRNVSGRLGNSNVAVDGLLIPVRGLTNTRFELIADGPEINEIVPDGIDIELRPGPYSLSGAFTFGADALELDDIRLEREAGEFEFDLDIGRTERRLVFSVDADGRDIRSLLSRVEGIEAEPAPFSIDTRGEFYDKRLTLDDLDITIGEATMDASGDLDLAEDARSTRFRFDLAIPNLAELGTFRGYRMRPQGLNVATTVRGGGGVLYIDETTARLDDSDITGTLRYEVGDVPRLDLVLSSDSLLLVSPLEEQEEPYDPTPEFDDGRMIPDAPLPMSTLASLDASINVAIGDLIREDRHFRNVALQVRLQDGELELTRLGLDAPSGRLDARARIAPLEDSAVVDIKISTDDLALGLSPSNADLSRTGDLEVNLTATGTNLRELAASTNGIILLDTRGGRSANNRIMQALYGDMLREILSVINPFYRSDPVTNFECAIFPLEIVSGQLSSAPSVMITTDKVRILTTVSINLATEALDLTFRTTPRRGIVISAGEIFNPYVKVVGSLAAPRLAVDEQGVLLSGGAAVATGGLSILARSLWDRLSRSSDPCSEVTKQSIEILGDRFAEFSDAPVN